MCEKAMHHTSQVGSESRPSEQGHDSYPAGSAESALRVPREKPGAAADIGTVECPGAHDDIPAGQPKAPAEYCPKDHLLTIHEVADLLSVPVSWVYGRTRHRCAGRIPGIRLGKYWRFRREEVVRWIDGNRKS